MNCFPNEVLVAIFSYLSPNDLVQCQLANENWNTSSLPSLYSKVTVNSHTSISKSPERAKYLKSIDVGNMFATYESIKFWDSSNLVEIPCAFLYKNALTSLTLTDRITPSETNSTVEYESYRDLLSRINEFWNLTHLCFNLYDNQQIDYFDTVIDDCKSIKSLTFCLVIPTLPTEALTPNVILPRPEIHMLVCD
ncbi:hypothetical protein MFLAVUS_004572 [Mucor flavus]|uniref:F-box domain-containing protein n=1 Tax=Mucor flavus TaxID=439312 RepID=A0ABP9YWA5_9FUNG